MRALALMVSALLISISACKGSGRDGARISLPTVEDAREFQRAYDAHFRDGEATALTAVYSHYVAEGTQLRLGLEGREPVQDPPQPRMVFAMTDGAFTCTTGCGAGSTSIESAVSFPLGPLTVVASPQAGPGRVLIHDPESPQRQAFMGLPWFDADARFIVAAKVEAVPEGETGRLTTSRGLTKELPVFADFVFELDGESRRLRGYASGPQLADHTSVLVPFTDLSSGESTYPVGRYLEFEVPAAAEVTALDFNRATNPLCAYSEHFNCPIPPADNRLELAIEAGERYEGH